MSSPNLVCPHNRKLFDRLGRQLITVRVNDPEQVFFAARDVWESGNRLFSVIVDTGNSFEDIDIPENWGGISVALFLARMGRFRNVKNKLERMRRMKVRVYLPCSDPENITSLQILSSVGVSVASGIIPGPHHWEPLLDLMTFAVLGPAPHSPIDPFVFVADNFETGGSVDWRGIYFEDPNEFFHLDDRGRVALSHQELTAGDFIFDDPSGIDSREDNPEYALRTSPRERFFLTDHPCSRCPGWRVCMGAFVQNGSVPTGCSEFATEMLEVVEQYRASKGTPREKRS
ncbi:MAG: hypothetical protein JW885_02335 [Deltaproteobacteria bacterium]|nr:hypothetical protein [Candidatus Zymogenaceae bacterium]